jgi:hypothetical protein
VGQIIGLTAVVLIFGIPIIAIWTEHQRKVLEIKLKLTKKGDTGMIAELEALRQEVRSLRDTSMQYDLSFDTALQRMEQRVERLEGRGVITSQTDDQMRIGVGR